MKKLQLLLLLFCSVILTNCGNGADEPAAPAGSTQTIELFANGQKTLGDQSDIVIVTSYVGNKTFQLGALSESGDIQFSIACNIGPLQKGTYAPFDTKRPKFDPTDEQDYNNSVLYGPYPKNPMPPLINFKWSYKAPELGLAPLSFTITEITDEQLEGSPYKTKRVKGTFSGTLASIEQIPGGYEYRVTGENQTVTGKFDVYCFLM